MEKHLNILKSNLNITDEKAIKVYNLICDEINDKYSHETTIEKVNNIIKYIFNNDHNDQNLQTYEDTLNKLGKQAGS